MRLWHSRPNDGYDSPVTAVAAVRPRLSTAWTAVAGRAAIVAGHAIRKVRPALPSMPGLAGAAMVSYGIAMIYLPAGVIAGGAFLLWIGTELNQAPRRKEP